MKTGRLNVAISFGSGSVSEPSSFLKVILISVSGAI
jgi:hypothetical protein